MRGKVGTNQKNGLDPKTKPIPHCSSTPCTGSHGRKEQPGTVAERKNGKGYDDDDDESTDDFDARDRRGAQHAR